MANINKKSQKKIDAELADLAAAISGKKEVKLTPNPIYQAIKQAKADAQMHETGDFFRKAAQVRTLSSEKLRLQLKSTSLEYDIDVDEQIATVIAGAFNLYPDKLQASVFSGSGAKYYPVLLAVNAQKHLVMRIETHKINRPYGASIAFSDEEIIKKILMGIQNAGIDSGKFEIGHAQTDGETDETSANTGESEAEVATVYKFKSGLVLQKEIAEEIINIVISILVNCNIAIGVLHSGNMISNQNSVMNIITFINLLHNTASANKYMVSSHIVNPVVTLFEKRKALIDLSESKIAYHPVTNMLITISHVVEACRAIVNDLYPQFIPIAFKSHLYNIRMQLIIRQYAIAVQNADKYLSSMSLTYWKVAETALEVADKIKTTVTMLPNYVSDLTYIKTDSIESFIDSTKPKLKIAVDNNELALQTSGIPLGETARKLLEVVAQLQCGSAAQFAGMIETAKNQHKLLTANNATLAAYLAGEAPGVLFEGGSNVNLLEPKSIDKMAKTYEMAAVRVGMENLFKMPSPNYLTPSNNDLNESEESDLNEIGWLMLYAAHSPEKIAKKYAAMIRKKTEWFIEKIGTMTLSPSKKFFALILDINEICNRAILTELGTKKLFFSALDAAMQLPAINVNSIGLDTSLGVVIADLAYMYWSIGNGLPVTVEMFTSVLQHVLSATKHKKHILNPLANAIRVMLASSAMVTKQDDVIQPKIMAMSEQFLQLLLTPDA